jgi:hypothetical protein
MAKRASEPQRRNLASDSLPRSPTKQRGDENARANSQGKTRERTFRAKPEEEARGRGPRTKTAREFLGQNLPANFGGEAESES